MKKYLTIHGHFYQPPRENPWTEAIDRQTSAHPFHDWNERINVECYLPNGYSRIQDATGRIVDIFNNYKSISFNFGPTLLSWLAAKAPNVYQKILQADRESIAHFSGHGSAIAQCYNHTIMPLCNERDQHTQIQWGIADFQYRFKRKPEAIWLPETAINRQTLSILSEYAFKFVILSPHQAERIRPLNGDDSLWQVVENGDIDTRRPYRCFVKDKNGNIVKDRYLDVFFYHGELARGISFEHALRNATTLMDRIDAAFGNNDENQLISISTDGESYGHHERFGDMGLAYLLNVEAASRHIIPINYAAFLQENPPTYEAELKAGPNGEGTAWSCAHGVGRWYRDCGCHTGGEFSWNQVWRTPLRRALDNLRDRLIVLTEEIGGELFSEVWAARNGYIDVILDRSPESIDRFLEKHAKRPLEKAEKVRAIMLMEMQRQTQLMYTSCGWFFTELSGIETVQIIKYAGRAIQLAESLAGGVLYEDAFRDDLKLAKSNIPHFQDGGWIYDNFVKPEVVSFDKVVNHFAMRLMFDSSAQSNQQVYIYKVEQIDRQSAESKGTKLLMGKVNVSSSVTLESKEYAYALLNRANGEKIDCLVCPISEKWDYEKSKDELINLMGSFHTDFLEEAKRIWRGEVFTLANMFYEERQKVMEIILANQLADIGATYEAIFHKHRDLIMAISKLELPLPEEIVLPAKFTLSRIILDEVRRLENITNISSYQKGLDAAWMAKRLGIALDTEHATRIFHKMLEKRLFRLLDHFGAEQVQEIIDLIEIADRMKLNLPEHAVQNQLYEILRRQVMPAIEKIITGNAEKDLYSAVSGLLRVAYRFNFNIKIYKDRLKAFEQKISQDPNYWP